MAFTRRLSCVALALAGALIVAGCTEDGGEAATTSEPAGTAGSTQPSGTSEATSTTSSPIAPGAPTGSDFTPQRPLPEGFPVFPGAELWSDLPGASGAHAYLFSTDGVDPGVCEFFGWGLADLGFAVDADCTDPLSFYVEASKGGTLAATVGFTDEPGGAGTGYSVVIYYDVWRDEWIAP